MAGRSPSAPTPIAQAISTTPKPRRPMPPKYITEPNPRSPTPPRSASPNHPLPRPSQRLPRRIRNVPFPEPLDIVRHHIRRVRRIHQPRPFELFRQPPQHSPESLRQLPRFAAPQRPRRRQLQHERSHRYGLPRPPQLQQPHHFAISRARHLDVPLQARLPHRAALARPQPRILIALVHRQPRHHVDVPPRRVPYPQRHILPVRHMPRSPQPLLHGLINLPRMVLASRRKINHHIQIERRRNRRPLGKRPPVIKPRPESPQRLLHLHPPRPYRRLHLPATPLPLQHPLQITQGFPLRVTSASSASLW